MRYVLLIAVVFFSELGYGQDLTGIWRGSFVESDRLQSLGMPSDRYKLEVQLDQHDKTFNSVTYSYKTTVFYGKTAATGTFNPVTGKVWLEETKIIDIRMQDGSSACIMTYKLQYSKNDNEEFLEGTWSGYGDKNSPCGKGTVLLHKVTTSDFYKEPFLSKKEAEKKPTPVPKANTDSVAKNNVTANANKKPLVTKKPAPVITKNIPKNNPPKPATVPPPVVAKKDPVRKTVLPPTKTPPAKTPDSKNAVTAKPAAPNAMAKTQPPAIKSTVPKLAEPEIADADTLKKIVPPTRKLAPLVIPKVLTTRENELVKTITVNTNEISINIYDNGTIDHDTVSVYLDKKLVISKQMLTTTAINMKFSIDETISTHELILVAENEGDIPPNTCLMVVRAGDKEFEVRITSTEQKNAVVIFKFEKAK